MCVNRAARQVDPAEPETVTLVLSHDDALTLYYNIVGKPNLVDIAERLRILTFPSLELVR